MGIAADDEMDLFIYLIIKTKNKKINQHFLVMLNMVPRELQMVSNSFANLEAAINIISDMESR